MADNLSKNTISSKDGSAPVPGDRATQAFDHIDQTARQERKRLFIGLITCASILVCLLLAALWYVPFVGLTNIHPMAPMVSGVVLTVAVAAVIWSALGLVLNILLGRTLPFSKRLHGMSIKLFLPLMTLLGRVLGISKERVRSSFIKVNNELVQSEADKYEPHQLLLLMPHCLQSSRCKVRLTYDIQNCKRCGKCPIKGLIELSENYGVHLAIATGGTIARRIVVQTRPKLILAVACERDLSSGIQDVYPIPTYGVLNMRPNGPCLDTNVDLKVLEKALLMFLKNPGAAREKAAKALEERRREREAAKAAKARAKGSAAESAPAKSAADPAPATAVGK